MATSHTMTASLIKKGMDLHQKGQFSDAANAYAEILSKEPQHPEALHLLGLLKFQSGEREEGAKLIEYAVNVRPEFSEALFNLGVVYYSQGMTQNAVLAYTRAVRSKSDYIKAWYALGLLFSETGQHEDGIKTLDEGIVLNPGSIELYEGQCRVFKRQGKYEECIQSATTGLDLDSKDVRLRIHRSEACFAVGRLTEGWEDYLWRTQHPDNPNRPYVYPYPKWNGEDLTDKTLLVQTEQGPGETFLFSSMINDIIARSGKCIIVTSNRLKSIMSRSFSDTSVIVEGTEASSLPVIDYQCALPDLGQWLRKSWDDFSQAKPSIVTDPERADAFKKIYKRGKQDKFVVGISWCSMDVHTAPWKSIPLEAWKPILSTPGVEFVSLQYGDTSQEIGHLESTTNFKISTTPSVDPISDLEGHLAQISAMDLVITTSNTTAHAAAAQGVETWVLLPSKIGSGLRWTWFCDRDESPWYASTHLFRQSVDGDWSDPITEAAIALAHRCAKTFSTLKRQEHFVSMARAFRSVGQVRAMGRAARAALSDGPPTSAASLLLAESHRLSAQPNKALQVLDDALDDDTCQNQADLLSERALSLISTGQPGAAVNDLETAEALKPCDTDILFRLANAHRLSGDSETAIRYMDLAYAGAPNNTTLLTAKGTLLFESGRIDDSVDTFDKVLTADPENCAAATSRAIALLSGERYAEGWTAYASRLEMPTANARYEKFPHPVWTGQPLKNSNVLVWTEQGVGEEILISTLIPDLAKEAQKVTLLCSERLVPLFKRSFPNVTVEERSEPLPRAACDSSIDFQMSWSDLGRAFRQNSEAFQGPNRGPVLLADPILTQHFKDRYQESRSGQPCIGLAWRSTTPDKGPLKSVDVKLVSEIINNSQATFVSLQHSPEPADLEKLATSGGARWITDHSVDPLADMDRAAAQVAAMDFVITVSNSSAHLAGGLGIPTALLLPPDTGRHWYWPRGHATSLWYNSVKLYETAGTPRWRDSVNCLIRDIQALDKA